MKIFTMVKGENDIVEDWVKYHGDIFGYENIYVIDNYSLDGTYQTLIKLKQQYNINITRLKDYKKKGEYMTSLLRTFCKNEFAFPIDIDEFIVYYDKQTNTINCDKDIILNYINSLPKLAFYKMNYIFSKILTDNGYNRAAVEATHGEYKDYGFHAKTFFYSALFRGVIDHGNHYVSNNYLLTKICLVHFHLRNMDQMKKKIYNNVKGLGHNPFNLNELKILAQNTTRMGHHHITNQINVLENKFKLEKSVLNASDISLIPLNKKILS
jgi:Glycosyl transferase family 2